MIAPSTLLGRDGQPVTNSGSKVSSCQEATHRCSLVRPFSPTPWFQSRTGISERRDLREGLVVVALDYRNSDNNSVSKRPMTEMMVSITDQVLIVCPTVSPKYSFTSQKPASFTCEKNSDPAPIASTTSARWLGVKPAASGAMMPAAVTVATVADPVDRRIRAATV